MFRAKTKESALTNAAVLSGFTNIQKVEGPRAFSADEITRLSHPQAGLPDAVNNYRFKNLSNIQRGLRKIRMAEEHGIPTFMGILGFEVVRGGGERIDLGIVSTRVVTDAAVAKIVDALRNNDVSTIALFKYHGLGTGTVAEAAADTALGTELTTEYVTNSTRPTGTQTNNGAAVYQTVATITTDSGTPAVTEHGVFSASTAGTLLDRSKFAAVNLIGANGDGIVATYNLTISSGG